MVAWVGEWWVLWCQECRLLLWRGLWSGGCCGGVGWGVVGVVVGVVVAVIYIYIFTPLAVSGGSYE